MKKFLFSSFFILGFINGWGQSAFNRAYHDRFETPSPFLIEIFGNYFFTTENADFNFGRTNLYKLDNNGNLKFKKYFSDPGMSSATVGFKTKDNKLLYIGWKWGCDVIDTSTAKSFIIKLDTNGSILFYTTVKTEWMSPNYSMDPIKSGTQLADSSICAFSDSIMFRFSKTGQYFAKFNLKQQSNINNITGCIGLQNGNCLLSAKSGSQNSLIEISPTASIIIQNSISKLFSKFEFYGSQKLLGKSQKLYKISTSYNYIDSSSVFGAGVSVADFICKNDTIYSHANSGTVQIYRMSDTLFNSVYQSTLSSQRTELKAICKNANNVGILTACNSGLQFGANNTFASISSFQKNNYVSYSEDAQVLSMVADSMYSIFNYSQLANMTSYSFYLRAAVWVKNNGTAVMTNVNLNSFLGQLICGYNYFQKKYTGLSVNPGDSVKLVIGWLSKFDGNIGPPVTKSVQFCVYSTLPDGMKDKEINNDGSCKNFTFTYVGIEKNDIEKFQSKIYPNPFKNSFSVESDANINMIEIYNVLGVLVKTYLFNENRIIISNSEMKSGIYFIKLETEKGTAVKKIIKD